MDWIKQGLYFSCEQCGNCCTGTTGYIWCTYSELKNIADHLDIPFDEFTQKYVKRVYNHFSLIEKPNSDCVFWSKKDGCVIYQQRPSQCRTYPFWPEIVSTHADWKNEAKNCQGIKKGMKQKGTFHSLDKIRTQKKCALKNDPLIKG